MELTPSGYEPAFWRPVLHGIATWHEVSTCWSLRDVVEANHTLNLKEYVERVMHERRQAEASRKR